MSPESTPPLQRVLPISPGRRQGLIRDAEALAAGGCTQLVLREPQRSRWDLQQALPSIKSILPGLILHATNVNAWRFAELHDTGLHLPSHLDPKLWRTRFQGRLGISCHSIEDIQNAESAGLDYVLLSPVFDPVSKEATHPAIGPNRASEIQRKSAIPIFGLGGISASNAPYCRDLFGVASLGYLFGSRTNRRRLSTRVTRLLEVMGS
ncbi:MAG: thiamine phosphate synthase [Myxococcota bacterium]|nr:thiamine phosphate synthase [Myxococcota bacterium]